MTHKQREELYRHGRPGEVYGVWNGVTKRFVFGIRASTPKAAWDRFRREHRKSSYCWRYAWRAIPAGWKNPPNKMWQREKEAKE